MKHIISLIRPHHYIKNIFVLLPLFFNGQFTNSSQILSGIIALSHSLYPQVLFIFLTITKIEFIKIYTILKSKKELMMHKFQPIYHQTLHQNCF